MAFKKINMKVKTICCIGAGYVGGPTMSVIALKCPDIKVIVVDKSENKINAWNSKDLNKIPVFEPGLKEIVKKVRNKNLFFSTNIKLAIEESQMIFLAVNTPTKTSGKGKGMAADLTNIEKSAKEIGKYANSDKVIVEKSTLPVRTAEKLKEILTLSNKKVKFEVLSNPEFLAEGTAIQDLFKSDRVLVGGDETPSGKKAIQSLVEIYQKWVPKHKILISNVWSAELSKLASNAMLAQRISSINSLSAFCKKTEANIMEVSNAIGSDTRIGDKFLKPSVGFGGSCFQKDILNLVYLCKFYGLDEVAEYWHQVVKMNQYQRRRFASLIISNFNNNIEKKLIAFLGWSFKKDTNDSRESSSIYVAENLLIEGAFLNIYDPEVSKEQIINDIKNILTVKNLTKSEIKNILKRVNIIDDLYDCFDKVDSIAILTEWDIFKNLNWQKIEKLTGKSITVFDGRMIISKKKLPKQINLITI